MAKPEQRPLTIVDDVDRSVELQVPVERVITFNTRNIEFVRAVGAIDRTVGVDQAQADQPSYWPDLDLTQVTESDDWERIVALDPEVVIYARNGGYEEAISKLEPFGIKVVVLTGWDLLKHHETVSTMGTIFGTEERAEEVNAFYDRNASLLRERLAGVDPVPVYLENSGDFASPIPGSGWHDMLTLGGGRNIFEEITLGPSTEGAQGNVHAFPIDPEAVLVREPEAIIKIGTDHGYEPPPAGEFDGIVAAMRARPGWDDQLPAIANDELHIISGFPGNACSKIVGALYVAKWLHPDLFEDVDPDAAMSEWTEEFQGRPLPDATPYRSAF